MHILHTIIITALSYFILLLDNIVLECDRKKTIFIIFV